MKSVSIDCSRVVADVMEDIKHAGLKRRKSMSSKLGRRKHERNLAGTYLSSTVLLVYKIFSILYVIKLWGALKI